MTQSRRFVLALFGFGTAFFLLFASGFVDSQDGFQYLAVARRMYYDGTFELPEPSFPEDNIHLSTQKGRDGKVFSPTGLGYSVALLPAVALEDVFLNTASLEPIDAFPLESDWPVLLFASFSNAFFGALLLVVLFAWLRLYELSVREALTVSFLGLVATNLFPYTKHVFPHMLFVSFLALSFCAIKRHSLEKKPRWLVLAGVSYGVVVLAYNPTYLLPVLPLAVYYWLTHEQKFNWDSLWQLAKDGLLGLAGLLPFLLIYFWFNQFRFGGATHTGYGTGGIPLPTIPPAYIMFEGIWGVLLSPGKSIFLFTPLLLLIPLFWHKLSRKYLPEIISFGLLTAIYVYFIGTLLGGVDYPVWHGDSSWGPRYMLPILPGLIILIGLIYRKLKQVEKLVVVVPLVALGIWIQLIGMLLPYQIRFAGLQTDAFFNNRNFNVYEYGNEIPRYSPVFTMTKTLVKRLAKAPRLFDHGAYDVQLRDGFGLPLDWGPMVYRGVKETALIDIQNPDKLPLDLIELQFSNHQVDVESSYSAVVTASALDMTREVRLEPGVEKTVVLEGLPAEPLELQLTMAYEGTTAATLEKKQIVFLQKMTVDGETVNLATIDYPYVSPVSQELFGAEYTYWGTEHTDPWAIWHMRSGVYENTFDLWWLNSYHYWDMPMSLFVGMGIIVAIVFVVSGREIVITLRKMSF